MRHPWKQSSLVLIAVMTVMTLMASGVAVSFGTEKTAPNQKTKAPVTFPHSYGYHTCAPWDGSALEIHLQSTPVLKAKNKGLPPEQYPYYSLNIWLDDALWSTHQWQDLLGGSNTTMHGMMSYCAKKMGCVYREGKARILKMTPTEVEGEVKVLPEDKSGKTITLPFKAPIYPNQVLCG